MPIRQYNNHKEFKALLIDRAKEFLKSETKTKVENDKSLKGDVVVPIWTADGVFDQMVFIRKTKKWRVDYEYNGFHYSIQL